MSFYFLLASLISWAFFSFLSNSLLAIHHVLSVIAFVLILAIDKKKVHSSKAVWALLSFSLFLILSVLANWGDISSPLSKIFKVKYFIISAITYLMVDDFKEKLKPYMSRILAIFMCSYFISVIYGFARYTYSVIFLGDYSYRVTGFFGMIMSYAYLAIWPALFLLFLFIYPSFRFQTSTKFDDCLNSKLFRGFLFFLSCLSLWLTQARGALLGLILAVPVLLYWKNKKIFYQGVLTVLVLLGLFVGISSVSKLNTNDSLRVFQSFNSENSRLRLSQYKMGWSAFLDKPLLGVGWRALEERSLEIKQRHNIPFTDFVGHSHNNLLEVLGSAGIFAFISFVVWIFFWLRDLYLARNRSLLVVFYLAGLVSFIVSGLVQSTITDSEYMFTFLAFFSLTPAVIYYRNDEARG